MIAADVNVPKATPLRQGLDCRARSWSVKRSWLCATGVDLVMPGWSLGTWTVQGHFFESNLCVVLKWCWQSLRSMDKVVTRSIFFSQWWWAVSLLLERPANDICIYIIVDSMYRKVHTMYTAGNTYPKQYSGLTATLTYHQGDLFVFASHGWIPRYKNIKKHWQFEVATPVQSRQQVNRSITEIQGQSSFACVLWFFWFCWHIAVRHPICSRCWRDNVPCWEHDMGTQDTVRLGAGLLLDSEVETRSLPILVISLHACMHVCHFS